LATLVKMQKAENESGLDLEVLKLILYESSQKLSTLIKIKVATDESAFRLRYFNPILHEFSHSNNRNSNWQRR
jgi:hypothetical protein